MANTYATALTESLFGFQQQGLLCDIVIQLQDCQVFAHRVVLAAASPRLKAIISNTNDSSSDDSAVQHHVIEMRDYSFSDALLWLEFMYTGNTGKPASAEQVQKVSTLFETLEMANPKWAVDSFESPLFKNKEDQVSHLKFVKEVSVASGANRRKGDLTVKEEVNTSASSDSVLSTDDGCTLQCTANSLDRLLIAGPSECDVLNCKTTKVEGINSVTSETYPTFNMSDESLFLDKCKKVTDLDTADGDEFLNDSCNVPRRISLSSTGLLSEIQEKEVTPGSKVDRITSMAHSSARKARNIDQRRLILGQQMYDCDQCGRTFSSKPAFQNHVKVHTDGRPYKCTVCGDSFRFPKRLSRHAWLFHHVNICERCGPECNCQLTEIKDSSSRKAVRYSCEYCSKTFARYQSMVDHKVVHSGDAPPTFICEICGKSFRQKGQLSLHQAVHSSKPYSCDICHRVFVSSMSLEEHTRKHTGECPIKCDTCGKRFRSRKSLRIHLNKHIGVVHQCDICGRHFSSKSYLLVHMNGHTNTRTRSHKCEFCNKAFYDKNSLHKHLVIHSEVRVRPYMCSVCGKSFLSKGSLKTHASFHGDERPYKCEMCGKGFKLKSHFNRHAKIHLKLCDSI